MNRKHLITTWLLSLALFVAPIPFSPAIAGEQQPAAAQQELPADNNQHEDSSEAAHGDGAHDDEAHGEEAHEGGHGHGHEPAPWAVIPFVLLLLMIATGPLFYSHFWHKNYPTVAATLGALVVFYYIWVLQDHHHPIHSMFEYFSFIALLTALFVASGGILIKVDKEGTPIVNIALLVIGAAIANVIGTTGASMLLIRPFIRLNQHRIRPYHVVFFIFMVSNVGGCLTPIGDPPLFLGFLKGVPFFWTLSHLWPAWIFGIGLISVIFYFFDRKNHSDHHDPESSHAYSGKIEVKGMKNLLWLGITIGAVFLDPNVIDWVPAITIEGTKFSFIREIIMLTTAFLAYRLADKDCLRGNEFDFEPIREVAFLFIGIFATMMPALQLISGFANSDAGTELVNVHSLYWATGMLSGVLDNAPTYLNFLAAGMGKFGLDINSKAEVLQFSSGHIIELLSISIAAVFFGSLTYIGNAPNFMVKSIAEQIGIQMPSFMGYVVRYSFPILVPVFILTWVVFFVLM